MLVTKLENPVDVSRAEAFVDLSADVRRRSLKKYSSRVAHNRRESGDVDHRNEHCANCVEMNVLAANTGKR